MATTSSLSELSRGLPQLVDQLQAVFTKQSEDINSALGTVKSVPPADSSMSIPASTKQSVASLRNEVMIATSEIHTLRMALSDFKVFSCSFYQSRIYQTNSDHVKVNLLFEKLRRRCPSRMPRMNFIPDTCLPWFLTLLSNIWVISSIIRTFS